MEPRRYRPIYFDGNNTRLWISLSVATGLPFLILFIYFAFRALTYPGVP